MERRLRCFVSPSGKNAILDWYCGLGRLPLDRTANRKQFRIIGYFEFNAFVMLIGCIHKQSVYSPAHALETAVNRRKLIESRIGGTCEYNV